VADIALDADAMRRDRQRYESLLEQAERQRAAWNDRADHLRQVIDGLARLVGGDPACDAVPSSPMTHEPRPPRPARRTIRKDAVSTSAGLEQAEESAAAAAPKGTDALRLVLESEPGRTWSLAELIEALRTRGWLPTSRRPEEGARISLKRLAERGAAIRTEDGHWRLAGADERLAESGRADPPPVVAETGPAPEQPHTEPPLTPAPPAVPPPRPGAFRLPVGATVTEL